MLFMNKKEEVLDIELTPYGKYLLSKGKFRPAYYAFFDDNMLYDSQYGGTTENQNEIDNRIRSTTPQLQTQYKFTGKFQEGIEVDFGGGDKIVPTAPSKRDSLSRDLGTSQVSNDKYPAIVMKFLKGGVNSYDLTYETKFGKKIIPQLSASVNYKIYIQKSLFTSGDGLPMDFDDNFSPIDENQVAELTDSYITSQLADDGSFLFIKNDYILADILEENTNFKMENFDIEVFKIDSSDSGEEELIPLTFAKKQKKQKIVNNILLDEDDAEDDEEIILETTNVEYYFDIYCDSNIDKEIIANSISEIKSRGFYTDNGYTSDRAPNVIKAVADIYGTNVTSADVEDCS